MLWLSGTPTTLDMVNSFNWCRGALSDTWDAVLVSSILPSRSIWQRISRIWKIREEAGLSFLYKLLNRQIYIAHTFLRGPTQEATFSLESGSSVYLSLSMLDVPLAVQSYPQTNVIREWHLCFGKLFRWSPQVNQAHCKFTISGLIIQFNCSWFFLGICHFNYSSTLVNYLLLYFIDLYLSLSHCLYLWNLKFILIVSLFSPRCTLYGHSGYIS